MRYRITTPVAGYTGAVGKAHFADGVAELDDATHPAEVAYCRAAGYGIEELDAAPGGADVVDGPVVEPGEMPKKSASTEAWRTWAADHGGMDAEEANTFSRDELVAHFTTEDQG